MRTIFIGASSFGLKCLEAIHRLPEIEIRGVITNPKSFRISYSDIPVTNVLHAEVGKWAHMHDIPHFEMSTSMSDPALLHWANALDPELFVVVGWYHMIPATMRHIAPAVGLHASLLPDYSGGAPLVWAMINGEKKTGISLFKMADGVDAGPLLGQKEAVILETDTIGSLYARIEDLGLDLLREQLPRLARGEALYQAQDESLRRVFPQRSPKDGQIDWSLDSDFVARFIRAQTQPYPGAFSLLEGKKLVIWEAASKPGILTDTPGEITKSGHTYWVSCGQGHLELRRIRFEDVEYSAVTLGQLLQTGGQLLGKV